MSELPSPEPDVCEVLPAVRGPSARGLRPLRGRAARVGPVLSGVRRDGRWRLAGRAPPAPAPESYTPRHLAERILTSKAALEGERKQVTVLFADVKASMELVLIS